MIGTLWRLHRILLQHNLHTLLKPLPAWRYIAPLLMLSPYYWLPHSNKKLQRGQAFKSALIEAGTIFIKLGQALSARRDFVPADIADAIRDLQDRCPPVEYHLIERIIQKEYGAKPSEYFQDFNPEPIASASIAQVHSAQLSSGEKVVVKLVRPDIQKRINHSVRTMRHLAFLLHHLLPNRSTLRPLEVVEEFASTLHNETNMLREASNASVIARNFANDDTMYTAKIYWQHTKPNILVMEYIEGIPVTNIKALESAGIERKTLAENGVLIFFKQVFRDNLFHADMHPGNVFVGLDGRYKAIDFGIVGSLNESDKRYLAENFIAFFNQDYHRVAQLHLDSNWVHPDTRVQELEAAIRSVCEPIMGLPLSQISFGKFLLQLFQVAKQHGMQVQPQLVLLQKTLFNIEGLGRQLYPDLDLWETAKPFLENWLRQHYSPRTLLRDLKVHWPAIRQELPHIIKKQLQNTPVQSVPAPRTNNVQHSVLAVGFLLGGILCLQSDAGTITPFIAQGIPASSFVLFGASAWMLLKTRRKN